jgi:hypothetical protein
VTPEAEADGTIVIGADAETTVARGDKKARRALLEATSAEAVCGRRSMCGATLLLRGTSSLSSMDGERKPPRAETDRRAVAKRDGLTLACRGGGCWPFASDGGDGDGKGEEVREREGKWRLGLLRMATISESG